MKQRKKLKIFQSVLLFTALTGIWQLICISGAAPEFMLPSPLRVLSAFISDFSLLSSHSLRTLQEAMTGLFFSAVAAFALAILMDASPFLNRTITPLLLLTQSIPTIAIAPLLILWMGYGTAPKVTLVFLVCFFPMTIGLIGAFSRADPDSIRLMKSMRASKKQIYFYLKIPQALPAFFSGLKISGAYSIVGAVIAEWLGGDLGLGVYMIRVRRSYSFDKMFAAILITSILSILLIKIITLMERRIIPWTKNLEL